MVTQDQRQISGKWSMRLCQLVVLCPPERPHLASRFAAFIKEFNYVIECKNYYWILCIVIWFGFNAKRSITLQGTCYVADRVHKVEYGWVLFGYFFEPLKNSVSKYANIKSCVWHVLCLWVKSTLITNLIWYNCCVCMYNFKTKNYKILVL